ncbi:MAG: glycosyltransferase, partial [Alphaproteobacteria bacterium]
DPKLAVPDGVEAADAREIVDTDAPLQYRGAYAGNFSLHSDLFRYALILKHGGWYSDIDVLMLRKEVPRSAIFAAWEDRRKVNGAILAAPAGEPFIAAALAKAREIGETPEWGIAGPDVVTSVLAAHGRLNEAHPPVAAYPIHYSECYKLFLPETRDEVADRCEAAYFLHLWNEMIRRSGIPKTAAPPRGSWLDERFRDLDVRFPGTDRLTAPDIRKAFALVD